MKKNLTLKNIRDEIVGNDAVYDTPFGKRNLFYADYTASGRVLDFIEQKMLNIERSYANTHTTDDYTGAYLTKLLHEAEKQIKKFINAGSEYRIISTGSGSTGALKKLQEILGIYIPPHTKDRIFNSIEDLNCNTCSILNKINIDKPVVFIGPYEHHTNELMWREAFADIVVIDLNEEGEIDLEQFRKDISKEKYKDRTKYCSFSAGSNITGIVSETNELAKIAHENNALIFFDFAATAPYVDLDISGSTEPYDAVFFSPHKFLGGPGTAGILVFHEKIYRRDLPPTTAGGGTVDYVGFTDHDFSNDIETREKAGTPPILQTIKTALVMDVKEKIGIKKIEKIEKDHLNVFFERFKDHKKIEILGNKDPDKRIPIISFNIKHYDRYLHPKLVTRMLSDLYGIQSRAGCSCAGPYGHRLLNIGRDVSQQYRNMIIESGVTGVKPGWVRVNLHYVFTKDDILFLIKAIEFIAKYGDKFLNLYKFNINSAEWKHKDITEKKIAVCLNEDFEIDTIDISKIKIERERYFKEAEKIVKTLSSLKKKDFIKNKKQVEDLKYFYHYIENRS